MCVDGEKLWADLAAFRCGCLSFEQVFDDKGHGLPLPGPARRGDGFAPTFVIGPRRAMLEGYDVDFPSPGGDMMLAGCFGLIKGLAMQGENLGMMAGKRAPAAHRRTGAADF